MRSFFRFLHVIRASLRPVVIVARYFFKLCYLNSSGIPENFDLSRALRQFLKSRWTNLWRKSSARLLYRKTKSNTGWAEGLRKYGFLKVHLRCLQKVKLYYHKRSFFASPQCSSFKYITEHLVSAPSGNSKFLLQRVGRLRLRKHWDSREDKTNWSYQQQTSIAFYQSLSKAPLFFHLFT